MRIDRPLQSDVAIVGKSAAMQAIQGLIAEAAASDAPVLIQGEVGTGRKTIARAIHFQSPRMSSPFCRFLCYGLRESGNVYDRLFGYSKGAFPRFPDAHPGEISMVEGGTLFLAGIDEMPLYLQDKVLQFLRGGTFLPFGATRVVKANVRIVASVTRDPGEAVTRGDFQSDLRMALSEMVLQLPPLRKREGDIGLLAAHFIREYADQRRVSGISAEGLAWLESRPWKGNVRELRTMIRHALVHGESDPIEAADFFRPEYHEESR